MAQKNLVIVESPAKVKKIEGFLGPNYKVKSCRGHFRDLNPKGFGINIEEGFLPEYIIIQDKEDLIEKLRKDAKRADIVWLASDEDREGEAISWHLYESLGLTPEKTRRIVFHEITKEALLHAIEHPRMINQDLVDAQQARRVLDRIVGYELSPILWKRIKPSISAGRVQSVAVKLIVEREREIQHFTSTASFRITAHFILPDGHTFQATLAHNLPDKAGAEAFLMKCKGATFTIGKVEKRSVTKHPAAPFITSTLQQEAARKLGFSVSQTMSLAQRLYEAGHITYMRTDSVTLSSLAVGAAQSTITSLYGEKYAKSRQYKTKSKGAQEAHEAIRPTYIANTEIEGTAQEKRLYNLIWKRTVASQMASAELERTTATIEISTAPDQHFVAMGEMIKFDGFLQLYLESSDEDHTDEELSLLPSLVQGTHVDASTITATERFTRRPARFDEASLVRKLEELGIGRPSTYATTIQTIQYRDYVLKGNKEGTARDFTTLTFKKGSISEEIHSETVGADKSKLYPTDMGIVVTDFLQEAFPTIMDYDFTAKEEQEFDEIAMGKKQWSKTISAFYDRFHPIVENELTKKRTQKVGERILGEDPKSGRPVSAKISRFGPVVMIGKQGDEEKPLFASIPKEKSMETITFEEAMELFTLPRTIGTYEGDELVANVGRYGPYIRRGKAFTSIPPQYDPLKITLEEAIAVLQAEAAKGSGKTVINSFGEDDELIEILDGRYGPYIKHKGNNFRIPKGTDAKAITEEECRTIIANTDTTKKRAPRRKK